MARTIEEIKDLLIDRCDPDVLVAILEPEIEQFVECCHDLIITNEDKINMFLDETDLQGDEEYV